ncbi:hypothetical protein GGF47_002661, partial [Coemansia sp. RSA 2524]
SVSLSDMVVLLESLPGVKEVTSYFGGLGDEFNGVPYKQIVGVLSDKYTTLNRNFKRWNVLNDVDMRLHELEDLAVSATALSAVCPSFSWYDAKPPLHVQLSDTKMMLVRNGHI